MHVPNSVQPQVDALVGVPREFRDFRDRHSGETLMVCGCGSSLSQLVAPERVVTIGVNDVGRLFDPDYLVVLNPRQRRQLSKRTLPRRERTHLLRTVKANWHGRNQTVS
jgi:hypothetical protein